MPLLKRLPASRFDERLCLTCGYRGPDLQAGRASSVLRCPECGEDLYSRPPRSYRELEGFVEPEPPEWDETAFEFDLGAGRGRALLQRISAAVRRAFRRLF